MWGYGRSSLLRRIVTSAGRRRDLPPVWSSGGLRLVEVEPVTVDRYGRTVPAVYFVGISSSKTGPLFGKG
jgi:hypothetical protein